jgi:hypothetical protein
MPEATPATTPPPLPEGTTVTAVQSAAWWKSKTLWVNLIASAIGLLTVLLDVLPPATVAVVTATVLPVLNILLRLVTFAPITGSPGATSAMAAQPAALAASVEATSPTLVKL